jgi:hypothetical protein
LVDNDDAWEPEGPLGHDERYVHVATPEEEREVERALGFRIRIRRLCRKLIRR